MCVHPHFGPRARSLGPKRLHFFTGASKRPLWKPFHVKAQCRHPSLAVVLRSSPRQGPEMSVPFRHHRCLDQRDMISRFRNVLRANKPSGNVSRSGRQASCRQSLARRLRLSNGAFGQAASKTTCPGPTSPSGTNTWDATPGLKSSGLLVSSGVWLFLRSLPLVHPAQRSGTVAVGSRLCRRRPCRSSARRNAPRCRTGPLHVHRTTCSVSPSASAASCHGNSSL